MISELKDARNDVLFHLKKGVKRTSFGIPISDVVFNVKKYELYDVFFYALFDLKKYVFLDVTFFNWDYKNFQKAKN